MALDMIAEIEQEQKRAAAKSNGGNASFFVLKAGEKALIRPLLNLNAVASILKHDFYNNSTGKYEVNALCAETSALELPAGSCRHCQTAKESGNKKLTAVKFFVIPLYVYGIKNAKGEPITYTDNEGNEKPQQGVRYLSLKASSDILATFLEAFREGTDITSADWTISRTGEKLETKYKTLKRDSSPFTVENVLAQDADSIVFRIAELNPFELIGNANDDRDPFESAPPAKPASKAAPDF